MVAKNFMHLDVEKPIVHWMLALALVLMVLLYAGVAPGRAEERRASTGRRTPGSTTASHVEAASRRCSRGRAAGNAAPAGSRRGRARPAASEPRERGTLSVWHAASARPGPRRGFTDHAVFGMALFVFTEVMLFAGVHLGVRDRPELRPARAVAAARPAAAAVRAHRVQHARAARERRARVRWPSRRPAAPARRAGPPPRGRRSRSALALGALFVVLQGAEWASLLAGAHAHVEPARLVLLPHHRRARGARGGRARDPRLVLGGAPGRAVPASRFGAAQLFWYFVVLVWPVLYWWCTDEHASSHARSRHGDARRRRAVAAAVARPGLCGLRRGQPGQSVRVLRQHDRAVGDPARALRRVVRCGCASASACARATSSASATPPRPARPSRRRRANSARIPLRAGPPAPAAPAPTLPIHAIARGR